MTPSQRIAAQPTTETDALSASDSKGDEHGKA